MIGKRIACVVCRKPPQTKTAEHVPMCKKCQDELLADLKAAEWKGWCDALDAIRASLQTYPVGGGDIGVMRQVERIVQTKLAAAEAREQVLREALEEAQWGNECCPMCGQTDKYKHTPDCLIRAALEATKNDGRGGL